MVRSSHARVVVASVLMVLGTVATSSATGPLSFRTVAVTGELAPGSITGTTFSFLSEQPAINDNGALVFRNRVQSKSGNTIVGIMKDVGGSLSVVMQLGQPAPPPGGNYSFTTSGNISDNGSVGFCSAVDTIDPFGHIVLFVNQAGSSSTIAYPGQPAPGVTPPATYAELCSRGDGIIGPPSINSSGSMATFGITTNGTINRTGLWTYTSGGVQLIARQGDPAPGAGGTATFMQLGRFLSAQNGYVVGSYPVINTGNETALYGVLSGSGTNSQNNKGVWQQVGGSLQLAARSGTQAAGLGAGVLYSDFGDPALNNAGHLAFRGVLTGAGIDSTNNEGLWSNATGALSLVVQKGDLAPDVSTGVRFGSFTRPNFYDVVLRGNGDTAFVSYLAGFGVTPQNDTALWAQRNGVLGLIAREGDEAPNTPAGTVFSDGLEGDYLPYMNDSGTLVFKGSLAGPGVTTANDEGFWVSEVDGSFQMLFREGDTLEVRPGDFRALTFTNYGPRIPTGGQDGRQRILNNNGELAFAASFTDGSQAILVFNVPEPSAIGLMLMFGAMASMKRQRWKNTFP